MRHAKLLLSFGFLTALSPVALAADLPPAPVYKAPAMVVARTWTGLYIGGHVGYAHDRYRSTDLVLGDTDTSTANGFIGGGQIGFNYQMGSIVVGVEGDYSWSNIKQETVDPFLTGTGATATFKNNYFATAGGRLGYAWDPVLLYVKGGAAWSKDQFDYADALGTARGRFNHTGWFVGAGVEWFLFNTNWTGKIEYDYLNFGEINETLTTTGAITANPANVKLETHMVKVGVNYLFRGF